jgi:hypothetical protein
MSPSRVLVVVLGNTNEDDGTLSLAATKRCDAAVKMLKANPDFHFACTGGWRENFNRSPYAHGEILARYIVDRGALADRFCGTTDSTSTVEDAIAVMRDYGLEYSRFVIVTSPSHRPRAEALFRRALLGKTVEFVEANDPPTPNEVKQEAEKLRRDIDCTPMLERLRKSATADDLSALENELRHYDTISYYPIVGAAGLIVIYLNLELGAGPEGMMSVVPLSIMVLALLVLYLRFAATARAFRHLIYLASYRAARPTLAWRAKYEAPRWPIPAALRNMLARSFDARILVIIFFATAFVSSVAYQLLA